MEEVTRKKSSLRRAWLGLENAYTLVGNKAKAQKAHDRYMIMSPGGIKDPKRTQRLLKGF
ncbi:hypothetical protein D7V97_08325 [Corallococcus sp. CA053C]|uniref:hypothetical protein n=1 Tax=Corallococcus sp. CA053C TaxID=2316732 RepID=UPI000EA2508B|nr:hypothetical protein [Corallococcus sp. CA053C]RKH12436.1 hypothetical protein D7V97_08325 [Corallococcus sp. CA053C]